MSSFNKVMIMGHMTRDVEIRTAGSTSAGNFGLAINRKYKTQSGEQREEVTFVDCTAWGKTADTMARYLDKGSPVFIEGRLKLDQWDDKGGGGKRSKLSVVVESFQFIGGGGDGQSKPSGGENRQAPSNHDDIPF